MPACPKWLSVEAKAEWRRVAKRLHDAGVLTYVDRAVLAMYCQAWARWATAEQMVIELGQTSKNDKGVEYMSPWLTASAMALKQTETLAAKLGMTPSDRSRISSFADGQQTSGKKKETMAERLFREAQMKQAQRERSG